MSIRLRRVSTSAGLIVLLVCLGYLVIAPLLRLQGLAFENNLQGFRTAYSSAVIIQTVWNTIGLAFGSLVVAMFFGTLLAWWATQLSPRLSWLRVLPILPIVIPGVANISGWAFFLSPRPGYLNAILRLLPWWWGIDSGPIDVYSLFWIVLITGFSLSAFVYVFVSAGLQGIGSELIEASRISGASALGTFFRVILPLLRPVMLYGGGADSRMAKGTVWPVK